MKYLFVQIALYLMKCIICHQYLNRNSVKIFYIADWFFCGFFFCENKTSNWYWLGFLNSDTIRSIKYIFVTSVIILKGPVIVIMSGSNFLLNRNYCTGIIVWQLKYKSSEASDTRLGFLKTHKYVTSSLAEVTYNSGVLPQVRSRS